MASAYKSAIRSSDDSDSDINVAMASPDSSHTLEGDSSASHDSEDDAPTIQTSAKLSQLPVELRNRILMLTSRGVSHR